MCFEEGVWVGQGVGKYSLWPITSDTCAERWGLCPSLRLQEEEQIVCDEKKKTGRTFRLLAGS